MPVPSFDQNEISVWTGFNQADTLLPALTECYGKPISVKSKKNGNVWYWKTPNISLSKWVNRWGYRVLRFPATQPVLAAISQILEELPAKPPKDKLARRKAKQALRKGEFVHCEGKPAAQLSKAEIACNFPVSYIYEEAESYLFQVVSLAIPANKLARINRLPRSGDGKFQECADGATNGRITFYFESPQRNKKKGNSRVGKSSRRATWHGKIYCKRLAPGAPWCIRLEVTLSGETLEKTIGKTLPSDLTQLPERLEGLRVDNFWRFEQFDWLAYFEAKRRSAEYQKIPFAKKGSMAPLVSLVCAKACARLAGDEFVDTTLWQIQFAKEKARKLKSESLERKIGAKKFSKPLSIMDLLPQNCFGR